MKIPFFKSFASISSLIALSLLLFSCEVDGVYKAKHDFPEIGWRVRDIPSFTFRVEQPQEPLNYYYVVRNDVDYAYYNLFIKYTLSDSSGRVLRSKMEEIILFVKSHFLRCDGSQIQLGSCITCWCKSIKDILVT